MSALPDRWSDAGPTNGSTPFPASLEEELHDVLLAAGLRGRQVRAVAARLGWSGEPATTLAAAAAQVGYTRERVRQLEERVKLHAAQRPLRVPLTAAAVRLVENAAPTGRARVAHALVEAGLTSRPFDVSGVFSAAALGRIEVTVCERDGMIVRERHLELVRELELSARRLVERQGAAAVGSLIERSPDRPTRQAAQQLLDAHTQVDWLDDRREWFRVRGAESPFERLLKKMLAVAPSLDLAAVDDGLRRTARPIALPPGVLLRLCASLPWTAVDLETATIASRVGLDAAELLSPTEQALVSMFRSAGPVLGFTQAVRLGVGHGLNSSSIGIYLLRSPVVERVGRGLYRLRGVAPVAGAHVA